jgi:serine/threonine protein phosphatase PrpC
MKVASMTDPGRVRKTNEDNFFADGRLGLFIVADGMGGHAGGEVASRVAVETISGLMKSRLRDDDASGLIRGAIEQANIAILAEAAADPKLQGMGTTVVLAYCRGDSIHLAHLGDSRAYMIRNGSIERLTEDHSLVVQMMKSGQLTAEEAPHFHLRNVVTRSLGNQQLTEPDLAVVEWNAGDCLLLCSDGLTNMVDESELRSLISGGGADVARSCQEAIDRANQNGGRDNITAILAYHE